ncbi:MAG: hypothetical protein U1A23_04860 [Candidatus Sungbacteria bacterium]|nr:hypothetical protein [bacterium]MDZ4286233.1 hypothetical protein [Candidatus Sungbacteria bacterium]
MKKGAPIKIKTIEDLAVLIQKTMASKEDIVELASKEDLAGLASKEDIIDLASKEDLGELREEMNGRFDKVEGRLDHLDARMGRVEADIHELRDEVVYKHDFEDALGRIKYIERKLGIESGV